MIDQSRDPNGMLRVVFSDGDGVHHSQQEFDQDGVESWTTTDLPEFQGVVVDVSVGVSNTGYDLLGFGRSQVQVQDGLDGRWRSQQVEGFNPDSEWSEWEQLA